jgi:choline dehydrogenase-like flavoprotein
MIYVVGSGPAGVACAVALIRRGCKVTMLDAGIELEPAAQTVISEMAGCEPLEWRPEQITALKGDVRARLSGIPLKNSYGSDFPYREAGLSIFGEDAKIGFKPSFAKGGLSNVWGAAVLPYRAKDISDWPITLEELAPCYSAVLSFMHLSAREDDLRTEFPLYCDDFSPIKQSRQAERFLADLSANRTALSSSGISFGTSRLAVLDRNSAGDSCKTCGMCLYGCPYGLIYNSSQTVAELMLNPNFTYVKDVIVTEFAETTDHVQIFGHSRIDHSIVTYNASKLCLGAGVLATTKIFLDSVKAYNRKVTLKDSQYFLLPLVRYSPAPGATKEQLHTLSQIFLEIFDNEISDRTLHLQIYTYNDYFQEAIQAQLGLLAPLFALPLRWGLERLLLIQGYLHSDISSSISLEIKPPSGNSSSQLIFEENVNPKARAAIKRVIEKLNHTSQLFKARAVAPLLKIEKPGRGYHTGGTLPMAKSPEAFQTDTQGRPFGLKRVHLVDATTFPSIPATTITLSIMANAFRIGDLVGKESAEFENR